MGLIRYFISLQIGSYEYCHGEIPLSENGEIKTFLTEKLAIEWIKNNPDIQGYLYTIKAIIL